MPRRLRIHLPGGFYHVTLRGNHQQDIFFSDSDRLLLNDIVARSIEKFLARVHAYCWMSNHIHLLLQAGMESISRSMHSIAGEYARIKQAHLQTTGHFFERRYHAVLVDTDTYLLELLRYIHMNPVVARLAQDPTAYRWSSHHNYIGARTETWLTTDFALRVFSNEPARATAAYQRFIADRCDEMWEPSVAQHAHAAVLGGDEFIARVTKLAPSGGQRRQSLQELITEACSRFEIDPAALMSPVRNACMVKVRAWIAYQAGRRGIAGLSAVARALGRTEGALRHAIRSYPQEIE